MGEGQDISTPGAGGAVPLPQSQRKVYSRWPQPYFFRNTMIARVAVGTLALLLLLVPVSAGIPGTMNLGMQGVSIRRP